MMPTHSRRAANRAMRTGGNFHTICRIRLKSGPQRWLQFDGKYELTDTGEPSRLVGVVADITERKALEQEAEELSERLITLQEEERQRIAQELHDSTVQHLVAANLNLMSLRSKAGSGSDEGALGRSRGFHAGSHEGASHLQLFDASSGSTRRWIAVNHPHNTLTDMPTRSGLTVKLRSSPKVDKLPFQMQRSLFAHCSGSAGQRPSSRVRITCLRRLATDRRSAAFDHH